MAHNIAILEAIESVDYYDVGSYLQEGGPVPLAALHLAANLPQVHDAEGMLSILLEDPRVDPNDVILPILADCRPDIAVVLFNARNVKLDDAVGRVVIASGYIDVFRYLLSDKRLVVVTPLQWVIEAINLEAIEMLSLLLNDKRFDQAKTVTMVEYIVRTDHHDVLVPMLRAVNPDATLIYEYTMEYGTKHSFNAIYSYYKTVPDVVKRRTLLQGKEPFFDVLLDILSTSELEELAKICIATARVTRLNTIKEHRRDIRFTPDMLCSAISASGRGMVELLVGEPYNIPICTPDCCALMFAITHDKDPIATLLTRYRCSHLEDALFLATQRGLQHTAVSLASLVTTINQATATAAVASGNETIAAAILPKAVGVDHRQVLLLIDNPSKLGMLDIVCRSIHLDLTWNKCILIRQATSQPSLAVLEHLLRSRSK